MNTAGSALTADRCFSLFYVAAFAVALVILYCEGRRRSWPMSSWLVLVAAVVTLGIIGSRLGAISIADWRIALAHASLPTTTGKTFVGLLVLGTVGRLLLQRFLGFRTTTLDASAFALPVGMAVARFGCLFGGCCYGKPTSLPWAVTYPPGSIAATVHELRGLVLPCHSSLPVHPVQLYEIGLLAIVVLALVRARRNLKQPGSLFLLYLVLHGWVRFLIEFARESAYGATVFGLRPLQAGLLVFCAGCATLLVLREKGPPRPQLAPVASSGRSLAVLGMLAVFLYVFGGWFTPVEQFVLAGVGLPALGAIGFHLLHSTRHAWTRRVALAAACGSVILLGASSDELPPPDEQIGHISYYDVSVSGATGSWEEICGGVYRYNEAGAGIGYTERWSDYTRLRVGAQGYYYKDNNAPSSPWYARPFVAGECRWAGLEAGALFGSFGERDGRTRVYPCGRLRLGPSDIVYLEGALLANEGGPRPTGELGIGTSQIGWGSVGIGICDQGFYLSSDLRTDFGLGVSPFVAYGDENTWHFGLGLRYNFKDWMFGPIRRDEY